VGKVIIFLLLAVAVYWWLRKPRANARPDRSPPPNEPETMISCAYCGLHVPLRESVAVDGRYYCGIEHRNLDGNSKRG
jgi:uncharacterized protein